MESVLKKRVEEEKRLDYFKRHHGAGGIVPSENYSNKRREDEALLEKYFMQKRIKITL
ncbi:MAG: hypothetical protein PHT91_00720 [Candidatus Nanoarchaeia archaeon]|nr:hypothetical protein [Candidatus Nanoarchaeia archaeon]MDD5053778.1 hypothetical protein [Candidatus Nanoarchaeia archaeon]MDD5499382.1 hypothetical protein [Candidatus Nanoarchaeia archaeon]